MGLKPTTRIGIMEYADLLESIAPCAISLERAEDLAEKVVKETETEPIRNLEGKILGGTSYILAKALLKSRKACCSS